MAITAVALTCMSVEAPAAGPVDVRNYQADGVVQKTDALPLTPSKEGFVLSNPTLPAWAEPARAADGSVTVYVDPTTKYYKYDPALGRFRPSTYEEVVVLLVPLRSGGKVVNVNGVATLTASFVWSPPPASGPPAGNPQPQNLNDYTLQRRFDVDGSVTETQVRVPYNNGLSSELLGFVVGAITDYGADPLVRQVAAAHNDQLAITVTPNTTYYKDGKKSSKADTVVMGAPIRVAGSFAWIDADWRFVANYVFQPTPTSAPDGSTSWTVAADRAETTSRYNGTNAAGNGQLNPGTTTFDLYWSPSLDGTWTFNGTWTTAHATVPGTMSGTTNGTWDPVAGSMNGVMVLTSGTGRFAGLTGGGTISGFAVPDISSTLANLLVGTPLTGVVPPNDGAPAAFVVNIIVNQFGA